MSCAKLSAKIAFPHPSFNFAPQFDGHTCVANLDSGPSPLFFLCEVKISIELWKHGDIDPRVASRAVALLRESGGRMNSLTFGYKWAQHYGQYLIYHGFAPWFWYMKA
jgi:hypothetical protein